MSSENHRSHFSYFIRKFSYIIFELENFFSRMMLPFLQKCCTNCTLPVLIRVFVVLEVCCNSGIFIAMQYLEIFGVKASKLTLTCKQITCSKKIWNTIVVRVLTRSTYTQIQDSRLFGFNRWLYRVLCIHGSKHAPSGVIFCRAMDDNRLVKMIGLSISFLALSVLFFLYFHLSHQPGPDHARRSEWNKTMAWIVHQIMTAFVWTEKRVSIWRIPNVRDACAQLFYGGMR